MSQTREREVKNNIFVDFFLELHTTKLLWAMISLIVLVVCDQ